MHYILHKVFTVLGGQLYIHSVRNFYNTSCYSNCNGRFENGYYCCYASDDIPADSELLLDYRITQPENNLKSASSTSKSGAAFVEITLLFRQRQIGKAGQVIPPEIKGTSK